jgi:hypothetical protein
MMLLIWSPDSAPNTEKYMTGQIAATLHHEVQHAVDNKGEKDVESVK